MSFQDPFNRLRYEQDILKGLQDQMRMAAEARRSLDMSGLSYRDLAHLAGEWKRREELTRGLIGPLASEVGSFTALEREVREMQGRYAVDKLIGASLKDPIARILGDMEAWRTQELAIFTMKRSHVQPALERQLSASAAFAYAESFRRTRDLLDVPQVHAGLRPEIASLLWAPTEGFGRYAPAALTRAADASSEESRVSAEAGVALATSQLSETMELQEELLERDDEDASDAMDRLPVAASSNSMLLGLSRLRVEHFFVAQEADALAHLPLLIAPDGRPIEDVVPLAVGARARRTLGQLLISCRRDAVARKLEPPPFRQSDSVTLFLVDSAFINPRTREGIKYLVDGLYFSLYEASNDMKSLTRYLPARECAPVRRVQRLRNRVFSHAADLEHPDVVAVQAAETLADLRALGLSGEPYSPQECQEFHDVLVADVTSFLERLRDRIRAGS